MILVIHVLACLWMMYSKYVFFHELNEFVIYFRSFFKVTDGKTWSEHIKGVTTIEDLEHNL